MTRRHQRVLRSLALIAIVAFGLWLRGRDLAQTPTTGDEGESAINALTILQRGVPSGTYLGLPVYENILTEPWPGNAEYEFRDSSYSERDIAIYHGWLPLYAMAASFKFFGVAPDAPTPTPTVQHSDDEIRRRVIAVRVPSVVFGALFMIFVFLAARDMFGMDAAMAAAAVGAVGRPFVYMAREARYHSATLAFSTGCCWAIWRVLRFGRWRDFLLAALLLVALFYTHLLAFIVAMIMFAITAPFIVRRHHCFGRVLATACIVAACAMPWVVMSGFLHQTAHIPPAREFLSFPADLLYYPILRIPYLLLPIAGLLWLGIVFFFHRRLPPHVTKPLDRHQRQIAFLLAWSAVGFLCFTFLIPAASYFYKRLTLPSVGPGVVWGSILFAAAARAIWRERSVVLAPILFVSTITALNMGHLWFLERPSDLEAYEALDQLRTTELTADTRIYCTPNQQLALTFLGGLPVQSVAPIRKTFLDTYAGPILLIDSSPPMERVEWEDVQAVARQHAIELSDEQAMQIAGPLSSRSRRKELAGKAASIDPPLEPETELSRAVEEFQRQQTEAHLKFWTGSGGNNPLLREFEMHDWSAWWPLFFYRFVNPHERMDDKLNYADRIKSSRAEVLGNSWVFFHCPPLKISEATTSPSSVVGQ